MTSADPQPCALLVTPSFFGYERDIVDELERQGYRALFLDERPSNSAFARAIMRVRKSIIGRRIRAHYERWLADNGATPLDLVLVIKAEVVPRWFLEEIRRRNPQARFVFYAYDSLANAKNCLDVLDLFDERLTFDRADAENRSDFGYLPLFYANDYHPGSPGGASREWDLSFVGTLHSERYEIAQRLFSAIGSVYGFFYVQARWYFAIVKYLTREHRAVSWGEVSFTPLTRSEVAEVFRNSRAVLDVQRHGQTGLTMRTFEVLASGAILVTTNDAIRHEPFYTPERVVVIPADAAAIDGEQVGRTLRSLPEPSGMPIGFDRYSVRAWVSRLVNEEARRP